MEKQPIRVLLIEDEEDDFQLTRRLLLGIEGQAYELDWAATYDEGYAAILADTHDVYLMDYRLNLDSGLDLLKEVKAIGCTAPLIMLTGLFDRDTDVQAMNAGASDYLVKNNLSSDLLERSIRYALANKKSELQQQELHRQLLLASRNSGMAEIASSVLHNVGNVLNSVNVSAEIVRNRVRESRIDRVERLAELLGEHEHDLVNFLTNDARGKQLQQFVSALSSTLNAERAELLDEIQSLTGNIDHIKAIVQAQQSHAALPGSTEPVALAELIQGALKINEAETKKHGIRINREFDDLEDVVTDRHKVLQILVNLIGNAEHAVADSGREDKQITLKLENVDDRRIRLHVMDNGIGISPENLTKIFSHGFTTKPDGHGFGLHSSALTAKQLGGSLDVQSDGLECGASFTLTLPVEINEKAMCLV